MPFYSFDTGGMFTVGMVRYGRNNSTVHYPQIGANYQLPITITPLDGCDFLISGVSVPCNIFKKGEGGGIPDPVNC